MLRGLWTALIDAKIVTKNGLQVRTDFEERSNDSLGHVRNFMTYKSTSVSYIPESTIHGNLPNDIYKKCQITH